MTSRALPLARTYLDHNATSPMRPSVRAAMIEAFEFCGNPSSIHAEGRVARRLIEEARERVGAAVGRPAQEIVFVSGGTEGAGLALSGCWAPASDRAYDSLFVGAGEHPCVLSGHGFAPDRVEILPLRSDGALDLEGFAAVLARSNPMAPAVALQAANNETGVIQPLADAARMTWAAGGLMICDAVQALGRISCLPESLPCDILVLSGHKIGGPKGVGALAFDANRLHIRKALLRGGGQERGLRAGTENVPAIVGFGVACEEAVAELEKERPRLRGLRDALEASLAAIAPDAVVFGAGAARLPNTSAFALAGESAETLVIALDLAGVSVSSGSACSSGKVGRSHVLAAMGVEPELAKSALRVSFGWSSVESDVAVFCETLEKTLRSMRSRRSGRAA